MSTMPTPPATICDPVGGDASTMAAMEARAEEAARLLSALGQSKRLMALCYMMEQERSVGSLAEAVGLGQSALSQHLARLRDLGLVTTRRDGQTIYYRLASDNARRLIELLYELYCK
jgi:DNA-binding transcriptional ArsR family regulator